jgi:hypothetical protein
MTTPGSYRTQEGAWIFPKGLIGHRTANRLRRDSPSVSSRPIMLQNIAYRDTKRALRRVRPGRIRRLGRALDREIRAMHAK